MDELLCMGHSWAKLPCEFVSVLTLPPNKADRHALYSLVLHRNLAKPSRPVFMIFCRRPVQNPRILRF